MLCPNEGWPSTNLKRIPHEHNEQIKNTLKIRSDDNSRGKAFDHGHGFLRGTLKSNALPEWE